MVAPIRGPCEVDIGDPVHAAFLQCGGQLYECLCFDSHCCYLVRLLRSWLLTGALEEHSFAMTDFRMSGAFIWGGCLLGANTLIVTLQLFDHSIE